MDEREELVATLNELYAQKLITATGGNLSVRVRDRPAELWITPSAIFKGSLSPAMMVRVTDTGERIDPQALLPSSERRVHTEILRRRPDLQAVIHTHAPWSTLLALSETPFLPVGAEAAYLGEIPRVAFIMPGTLELGQAVAEALGERGYVALMQNHGLVVAGPSLRKAADLTAIVEHYSELILRCLMLGKSPPLIPEAQVQQIRSSMTMIV